MKKLVFLTACFSMFGLVMPDSAWGGPFYEMKSYKHNGTADEYYNVGGGYKVECDDDEGDAPAKTRAYWIQNNNVYSRRCYISPDRTGGDYWTERESVGRCTNNTCNTGGPTRVLPSTTNIYICGKKNQGITVIGDSVFVGGGNSDDVDCWYQPCASNEHFDGSKCVANGCYGVDYLPTSNDTSHIYPINKKRRVSLWNWFQGSK